MVVTPYRGFSSPIPSSTTPLKKRGKRAEELSALDSFLKQVDPEKYKKVLAEAGKKETPKLSLLQRVGEGLNLLSTGNAVYKGMEDNSLASGLKQYGKDIVTRGKTALTGRRPEEYAPEKTFKDVLVKSGFKDTKGKLDFTDVAGFGLDVLADPSTLFGGEIVKVGGKVISPVGKLGKAIVKKIPYTEEIISSISRAFTPLSKQVVNDLKSYGDEGLSAMGDTFSEIFQKYEKGGEISQTKALQGMSEIADDISKKVGKENLPKIIDSIESGIKTGDATLDEQADLLSGFFKARKESLTQKGIDIGHLDDYFPHVATNDFLEQTQKKLRNPNSVPREVRMKLDPGMERNFTSWIDENGNRVYGNTEKYGLKREGGRLFDKSGKAIEEVRLTLKEANEWSMKELGVKMFEDNPYIAQAKYFVDTEKALKTQQYFEDIKKLGVPLEQVGKQASGVKYFESTIPELKGVALPEEILNFVEKAKTALTTDEGTGAMLKFYDDVMNIWKGSVYGWFPSSHTTNTIGGLFHNFIAGVTNPKWYTNARKVMAGVDFEDVIKAGKDAGKKISSKQLLQEIDDTGFLGAGSYLDIPENLARDAEEKGLGILKKLAKKPQNVSKKVEEFLRVPMYLEGRIKLGLSPKEAADRVIKFHFDYSPSGMSTFEKNFMKRIMPFYTFTRNVIPLTIEQMLLNPGKYAAVYKAQKATGMTPNDEDFKYLPKYLQQQIILRQGDKYVAGFKLPFEEAIGFAETPLRKFVSSTSPFFKIPIEIVTGKNIFKDIDIEKDTSGNAYKKAPDFVKEFLEYTEVEVPKNEKTGKGGYTRYYVNPFKRYAVENFPFTSRLWNTIYRVANGDTNVDRFKTITTAIKEYDVDSEKNKSYYEKELLQELQGMLERLGGGYNYSNFVIPKEKKNLNITPPTKK